VVRPEKLGDLVVATPVFRALRNAYPRARISVLTDQIYGVILQDDPHVDEVITIDWKSRDHGNHESIGSIIAKLRPRGFDLALILFANWSGWNLVTAFAGIKRVVQLGGTWPALFLGHQMVRRKAYERRLHYRDYFMETAEAAGAFLPDGDHGDPKLFLNAASKAAFLERYPRRPGTSRVILHPFGHGTSPNYSPASYASLALQIAEELGLEVWLTGGRGDLASWPGVSHPLIHNDWLGTLSLREMMVACNSVDAVICGSTGVIHMASALGTPCIGLFCPHPGSHPSAWGPIGARGKILIVPVALCRKLCSSSSSCSADNECDLICGISHQQIIDSLKEVFQMTNANDYPCRGEGGLTDSLTDGTK
jgi:ADP-heptose:LPS heptosyltransferase